MDVLFFRFFRKNFYTISRKTSIKLLTNYVITFQLISALFIVVFDFTRLEIILERGIPFIIGFMYLISFAYTGIRAFITNNNVRNSSVLNKYAVGSESRRFVFFSKALFAASIGMTIFLVTIFIINYDLIFYNYNNYKWILCVPLLTMCFSVFYSDSCVIFFEDFFYSGSYKIYYGDINSVEIVEEHRSIMGEIFVIKIIGNNSESIGFDKLFLNDFIALKNRIIR